MVELSKPQSRLLVALRSRKDWVIQYHWWDDKWEIKDSKVCPSHLDVNRKTIEALLSLGYLSRVGNPYNDDHLTLCHYYQLNKKTERN